MFKAYRLCGLLLLAAGTAQAVDVPAVLPAINTQINQAYPALEKLYKELHQNPELAFQEVKTSARLAAEMRSLGFTVTEGIRKTGVVAIYRNGPGPTVMVRTDMDGLPMEEKTGLPYASRVKATWNGQDTFVAHSCGHDVHMAAWIGTARTLLALKNQWSGTLMFVAQPAEEALNGAQAMMDDGLYQKFGTPAYVLGLHNDGKAAGLVGYDSGPVTTFADGLEITFKGVGAHGSAPHAGIDPILIASRFVVDVQGVVSRERDPREFGVVTVGAFQGGSAGNIIPDTVVLRGTVRSLNAKVRDKLLAGIRRTAEAEVSMAGAPAADIKLTPGAKAVINDAALIAKTAPVFRAAFGDRAIVQPFTTASEDFSVYGQDGKVPLMFFFVGAQDPEKIKEAAATGKVLPYNHSPYYAPLPEPSIKTSVQAMSLAVLNLMPK